MDNRDLIEATIELRNTNKRLDDLIGLFREHCKENEADSDRITRLEGKVNAWTAIQATFTAIASAVAGFIGTRR